MRRYSIYIVVLFLVGVFGELSLSGQEVLNPVRVHAKVKKKNIPALGLPIRNSEDVDYAIWFKDGCWHGADSLRAIPSWVTETIAAESVVKTQIPNEIVDFCKKWAVEKPEGPVYMVAGPLRGGQFIAVCTRARSSLNWKSIGFIIPESGLQPDKTVWYYSCSVNWIEWLTGYNIFPELPSNLQELIEEMTAAEHLCSFNELSPLEYDIPDPEVNYDWEMDMHEIL